ncbi:MAG TPA: S8 family serine peptidase [Pyrinomonadaceae bacterium]|jgi:hypothetical protein
MPKVILNCLTLFCLYFISLFSITLSIYCQDAPPDIPNLASGIVVVNDEIQGESIYLVDQSKGGIYKRAISQEVNSRLTFSQFTPYYKSNEIKHPSAIAYNQGKLFVCDKSTSAVFELDIKTLSLRSIIEGGLIKNPTTIAVSERGEIAVASDEHDEVILYTPKSGPKLIDFDFDEPERLFFLGSKLIVMNEDGEVYQVQESTLSVSRITLPNKIDLSLQNSAKDLGAFLNIFYFARADGIFAYAQSNRETYRKYDIPLFVLFDNSNNYSPSKIFVTNKNLFILENKTKSIIQLGRPIPTDIEFNGDKNKITMSFIILYDYLNSHKMLSTREFVVERNTSVEDLLMEQRVILSPLNKVPQTLKISFVNLICTFNEQICKRNDSADDVFKGKVKQGDKLHLPNLQVQEYETTALVPLEDKTVDEYLREYYSSDRLRFQYINTHLRKDNPQSVEDKSKKNILERKGNFRLPVKRWKATLLINSNDLKTEFNNSLFNTLLLHETFLTSKQASDLSHLAGSLSTDTENVINPDEVAKNRANLKKNINFPVDLHPTLDLSSIIVAVGEKFDDVDFNHPDFIRGNNESIWLDLQPDGSDLPRHQLPQNRTVPSVSIGDKFSESDHGTHVSGIIAANSNSLTPGLIPSLKGLVLIDTKRSSEISQQIQNAINQNVFIFNFSFTLPNEQAVTTLKTKMNGSEWRDRLFVVAAGKAEDQTLQDLESNSDAPIKWNLNTKNIIGVSAVVTDGNGRWSWMDPIFNSENETDAGAKFGKRFIQLVAPGRDIFSSANRNAYKKASGTSQAVPQVVAVASILFAQNVTTPAVIKARLMYTSDWYSSFKDKVYGGLLNAQKAIWEPTQDILQLVSGSKIKKSVKFDNNPDILITSGQMEVPDGESESADNKKIKFNHIFRISRQPGHLNLYRVFFYDSNTKKLRIINDAALNGKINCKSTREWDKDAKKFKDPIECPTPIDISDFFDYVADIKKIPSDINF